MPTTKIDGDSLATTHFFKKPAIASVTTAANTTYTAAQLLGGVINRDPNGAARSDTTPTAAQIVSEMNSKNSAVEAYSSFRFVIANTGTETKEKITLAGGTGVTIIGMPRLEYGRAVTLIALPTNVIVSSEAVNIYVLSNTEVKIPTDVASGAGSVTFDETKLYVVDSDDEQHEFLSIPSVAAGDKYVCEVDWTNFNQGRWRFMFVNGNNSDERYATYLINGNVSGSGKYKLVHSSDHSGSSDETSYSSSTNPFNSGLWYFTVEKVTTSTTRVQVLYNLNDTSPFLDETYTDHDSAEIGNITEIHIGTISAAEMDYTLQKTT